MTTNDRHVFENGLCYRHFGTEPFYRVLLGRSKGLSRRILCGGAVLERVFLD